SVPRFIDLPSFPTRRSSDLIITETVKVIVVVKLYKVVICLFVLSFFDSHKLCAMIIQIIIPKIATSIINNKRHSEYTKLKFHIVVKMIPKAPVVKAIDTTLLKLFNMLNGLFANVIPLTRRKIPLDLDDT